MIVVEQVWGKQHAAWLLAIDGVKDGVTVMPAAGDNCVTMLYFNGVANYVWQHSVVEAGEADIIQSEYSQYIQLRMYSSECTAHLHSSDRGGVGRRA